MKAAAEILVPVCVAVPTTLVTLYLVENASPEALNYLLISLVFSVLVISGDMVIHSLKRRKEAEEAEIKRQTRDERAKKVAHKVCRDLREGEEKDVIVYYAILAAIRAFEDSEEQ